MKQIILFLGEKDENHGEEDCEFKKVPLMKKGLQLNNCTLLILISIDLRVEFRVHPKV